MKVIRFFVVFFLTVFELGITATPNDGIVETMDRVQRLKLDLGDHVVKPLKSCLRTPRNPGVQKEGLLQFDESPEDVCPVAEDELLVPKIVGLKYPRQSSGKKLLDWDENHPEKVVRGIVEISRDRKFAAAHKYANFVVDEINRFLQKQNLYSIQQEYEHLEKIREFLNKVRDFNVQGYDEFLSEHDAWVNGQLKALDNDLKMDVRDRHHIVSSECGRGSVLDSKDLARFRNSLDCFKDRFPNEEARILECEETLDNALDCSRNDLEAKAYHKFNDLRKRIEAGKSYFQLTYATELEDYEDFLRNYRDAFTLDRAVAGLDEGEKVLHQHYTEKYDEYRELLDQAISGAEKQAAWDKMVNRKF